MDIPWCYELCRLVFCSCRLVFSIPDTVFPWHPIQVYTIVYLSICTWSIAFKSCICHFYLWLTAVFVSNSFAPMICKLLLPTPVKKQVICRKWEKPPSLVLTSLEGLQFVEKKDASLRENAPDETPKKQGKGGRPKKARSKHSSNESWTLIVLEKQNISICQ